MRNHFRTAIVSAALGAICGALLLLPAHGYAVQAFQAGVTCEANSSSTASSVNGGARISGAGSAASFTCPYPSGTYIRHTVVNSANVAVYDPNTTSGISASFCVRDYTLQATAGGAVVCGSSFNNGVSTVTGGAALTPALTAWNNASYTSWYPYATVTLGGSGAEIVGLYAAAP